MSRKQTNLFFQVLARHWDDSEFEAYFGGWNAAFPATHVPTVAMLDHILYQCHRQRRELPVQRTNAMLDRFKGRESSQYQAPARRK
jgi:hypothetical protein